jgi:MerR family transcriptional regulator, redox-sensitive transcriptional activator SoxR
MQTLAIGELSRKTGLSQSAIRYYEAEGLLQEPKRSGGWRTYSPDAVDRVRVIQMARALGFTLAEVRTLLLGFSSETPPTARWQQLAERKIPEVDALIQRATAMKRLLEKGLRCDCVTVQDCILFDCNPPVTLARRK